jgi:hypothetical protein
MVKKRRNLAVEHFADSRVSPKTLEGREKGCYKTAAARLKQTRLVPLWLSRHCCAGLSHAAATRLE